MPDVRTKRLWEIEGHFWRALKELKYRDAEAFMVQVPDKARRAAFLEAIRQVQHVTQDKPRGSRDVQTLLWLGKVDEAEAILETVADFSMQWYLQRQIERLRYPDMTRIVPMGYGTFHGIRDPKGSFWFIEIPHDRDVNEAHAYLSTMISVVGPYQELGFCRGFSGCFVRHDATQALLEHGYRCVLLGYRGEERG